MGDTQHLLIFVEMIPNFSSMYRKRIKILCLIFHVFFFSDIKIYHSFEKLRGCPRGVMVKEIDCEIVEIEFEL